MGIEVLILAPAPALSQGLRGKVAALDFDLTPELACRGGKPTFDFMSCSEVRGWKLNVLPYWLKSYCLRPRGGLMESLRLVCFDVTLVDCLPLDSDLVSFLVI